MLKKSAFLGMGLFLLFSLGACSSSKKVDLSDAKPEEGIQAIADMKVNLIKDHVDVMAFKEFREGLADFYKAKKQMKAKNIEKVMTYLPLAQKHFEEAKTAASEKKAKNKRILKARKDALDAGAMESKNVINLLATVDKDLRSESKNFSKDIDVEEMSELQKKYLNVEAKAVQFKELNTFRQIIFKAKNNNAKSLAPVSYRQALVDLRTAENLIYQNPRNPKAYKAPVTELNMSSKLLDDIMNKLMGEAKGSSEAVAKRLVLQERKLGKLSSTVDVLKGDLSAKEKSLSEKEKSLMEAEKNLNETTKNLENTKKSLEAQKNTLLSAQAQVKFQEAMDDVRKNFDSDEAEVYQQGKSLILRLKKLNFKSGSAEIPDAASDLLTKIGEVIKNIEPEKVQVQGHTDSVGNAEYNQKLSSKRAESVQKFLDETKGGYSTSSVGYGESKPLANNETEKGRTLNRRVDIVIDAK